MTSREEAPSPRPGLPWFEPSRPRLLAHRGFTTSAPENTLLAFRHAVDLGARYLETDIQVSRDGVAVLSHDADLATRGGRRMPIASLTMAELEATDLGEGQSFVSLRDALLAFPTVRFNLDLKAMGAAVPAAAAIVSAGAVDRVLVGSFSERRRRALLRLLPGVATSASIVVASAAVVAAGARNARAVRRALRGVHALQVPVQRYGITVLSPAHVDCFHWAGVEVHAWTINDVDEMRRLIEMGVDGLVTDRIDLALALVASP